jgi:hypothetical protein
MPAACVAAACSASQAALGALSPPPTQVGTRATATATARALAQQRVYYYALKQ